MTQSKAEPTSARDFRSQTRDSQRLSSQLALLNNIGVHITDKGIATATYLNILEEICRYTTLEHGLIVVEVAGVYKVKASQEAGLLSGSRIASSVSNNIAFLPHQPMLIHHHSEHRLWSKPQALIQSEWLIPIQMAGQHFGFIGLASETPTASPSDDQVQVLQTAAAIISLSLQQNAVSPPSQDVEAIALLTPREKEVFALIPLGLSNAEIGKKLGITGGTAKIHVEKILSKLGLSDRTQAAVKATKMGYVP